MKRSNISTVFACASISAAAFASVGDGVWPDPIGDAVIRRTDQSNNGSIPPGFVPIDLLRVDVTGWTSPTPTTDPYSGSVVSGDADLMMLRIRFAGLVSPPGPLGFGDAGGQYDPMRYGARPVYGVIGLDVDDQKNSGGELGDLAKLRYLANVGRFGKVPYGSIAERAALRGSDLDASFWSGPQYERTGDDFSFVMCGCSVPQVMSEGGNSNGLFDAGETWVLRGRFFERAQAFASECGTFGGSDFGFFDPMVNVRWTHDTGTDETVVEFVFALTMAGAAMLTGEPQQSINLSLFDHTSLAEAIWDLSDSAENVNNQILEELMDPWRGRDWDDYLRPQDWRVSALIGTAYTVAETDARYVWTDTGFDERLGDVNGDGLAGALDQDWCTGFIALEDGGASDCDGSINGSVVLCDFARNFSVYDFNGDGTVDECDRITLGRGADLNDDGVLDFFDVAGFLQWFSSHDERADLDGNNAFDFFDVLTFLQRFSSGCL